MTTDYEFLVPSSCICMYKNIRECGVCGPPGGRGPVCLAHSAHPIATPLLRVTVFPAGVKPPVVAPSYT